MESCYERADELLPERWGERPELVHNKSGFVPFSSGKSIPSKADSADHPRAVFMYWKAISINGTSHCHGSHRDSVRHIFCAR